MTIKNNLFWFYFTTILLFSSNIYAEEYKYNPFINNLDITNNKASEISLADLIGYYGYTASPPTVESALQEVGASRENVASMWSKSGTSVYTTTPTDNVGIGRSNPSAKLHIFGAGTGTGFALRIADSTPTDRLVVLDNGRMGIGTTNPGEELVVVGDIDIEDATPHLRLTDTTASEDDFEIYTDTSQFVLTNATDLIDILYVNSSNNLELLRNTSISKDLIHEFSRSASIENLAAADDNMILGSWTNNVTINKVGCAYVGTGTTPATITLEDGSGNVMTHGTVTCVASGTDITFVAVTANNTLNAGELLRFDVSNAVSPETDEYSITIGYTE